MHSLTVTIARTHKVNVSLRLMGACEDVQSHRNHCSHTHNVRTLMKVKRSLCRFAVSPQPFLVHIK